jgi:precorrin-2/cobalt-factor-2 C20-methyltransferase
MDKGKLYGVGVGPGDKELLTLKALRILREADIIAVPLMKSGARTAYDIIEDYIRDKETIEFLMPMTKDFKKLEENYGAIADRLEEMLNEGKNIAFITLGDVTVYSTYMQINRMILERGFETELIPGITSFCAAAARLNMALCERDEPLIILPASYEETENVLDKHGTKVLMKASRAMGGIKDALSEKGLLKKSVMVECCGMENERIYTDLNEIDENSSYFSVVIVKD